MVRLYSLNSSFFSLIGAVIFATFAFFFALPAYAALGAIWRISVLINHPLDEAHNKKWRKCILLLAFLPSMVIGIVFGIVGMGKAVHFTTAHGVRYPPCSPSSSLTSPDLRLDYIPSHHPYYIYLLPAS